MGVVLGGWQLQNMSWRRVRGTGTRLLSEEALEDGVWRTIGRKISFFTAEEAAWWAAIFGGGEGGESLFLPHSRGRGDVLVW